MKKRILSILISLVLCLSLGTLVLAAESAFDPTVTINRETEGKIIVTVNADDAILSTKQPTLSVPCGYTYVQVTGPNGNVPASVADGMVSFIVAACGTYTVRQLFAVTFDANGGTCATTSASCDITGKLSTLPSPTREGYTFDGWYDAAEGGNQVTADTSFGADTIIYAQWTINTYTITFDANGGTCGTASTTVTHGGTISSLPSASMSGYWYFNGWYTASTGGTEVTTSTTFTSPTTIYAQYYYSEPYYPSTPVTPPTTTEKTENEDGSTTTTVTDNKTGTVTETTENVDGSITTVETKKDGTVTEKMENTDGSTVTTETKPDGSSTTTTELADGTTGTAVTDETGKTEATVTISEEAAASEEPVALPIPAVTATTESEDASTITVTTNSEENTKVEIPVAEVSTSTVAVIVNEDGTETVITETKMTDEGLVIDVPDGATVKIVDNSTDFHDVEDHHWEEDAVDFASARGLVNGVGNNLFDKDGITTRAHVVTLLARLAGVDTTPEEGEKWYDKGHDWAVENGITYAGNMNGAITRHEMMTLLWRYMGSPESDHDISHFTDIDGLTAVTEPAARWAVEIGLVGGHGNGTMTPTDNVTRGQLAQFMMNFIQLT